MRAHPGEKILAGELIAAIVLRRAAEIWADRDKIAQNPLDFAPSPQTLIPIVGAYSALGLLALAGDQAARLAAGIGALVTMVIVLKAAGILFQVQTTAAPATTGAPQQGVTAI